ncbi:interferon-induced 35 kDa protein homolog [Paramormyrops kingsleyae]|uniref:Interferon-induced 35 kDa protein homolog n=1 Tax=Paramormyrops kingsleyae TaxID=1676925 RepID=A0A3B3RQB2_9TELE|nr:interferon-induced 35 kDa protein homolog [Paramormyrops kingsleyae]XP_023646393.1 interferon-induced 35 kDa protein homolog [Paramormyrops kingsleyae]XP_023646394.1 interferon-induced 35 kDa protein homolog [Paramormyrops kingsleyae]
MSNTEDSAVTNGQTILKNDLHDLQKIKQEIKMCETTHAQLLTDQKELSNAKDDLWILAERFQKQSEKIKREMEEEEKEHSQRMDNLQVKLEKLQKEQDLLKAEEQQMKDELERTDKLNEKQRRQAQFSAIVPEKRLVFSGDASSTAGGLDVNSQIVYPMEGGTALLTFEEEKVAQQVLALQKHVIRLEDCSVTLEVKPVQFLIPSHIEMDIYECPRCILISNLPKDVEESRLLDRLELHFGKTRNGGGEVETTEMLEDSNVVIKFLNGDVTEGLVRKKYHDVQMDKKERVRVTPFVNGEVTTLQTQLSVAKRTVLLTGIPSIMDEETMQDSLEVHFQKSSNGGGEIEAIAFNSVGHKKLAVFDNDDSADP